MKKEEKQKLVEVLTEDLKRATGIYFIDFTGLSAGNLRTLRTAMRKEDVKIKVVKNMVARFALKGLDLNNLLSFLEGPTALLYVDKDSIVPAKILNTFSKEKKIKIKGGLVEGRRLAEGDIKRLALIPSREELLGNLLSLLSGPLHRLHNTLSAPLQSFAMVINQVIGDRVNKDKECVGS